MATEAQRRANAKYDALNTVALHAKLNRKTDADIISRLEAEDNKQAYVKDLIRMDIAAQKKSCINGDIVVDGQSE